jgi:hypothetical protein
LRLQKKLDRAAAAAAPAPAPATAAAPAAPKRRKKAVRDNGTLLLALGCDLVGEAESK